MYHHPRAAARSARSRSMRAVLAPHRQLVRCRTEDDDRDVGVLRRHGIPHGVHGGGVGRRIRSAIVDRPLQDDQVRVDPLLQACDAGEEVRAVQTRLLIAAAAHAAHDGVAGDEPGQPVGVAVGRHRRRRPVCPRVAEHQHLRIVGKRQGGGGEAALGGGDGRGLGGRQPRTEDAQGDGERDRESASEREGRAAPSGRREQGHEKSVCDRGRPPEVGRSRCDNGFDIIVGRRSPLPRGAAGRGDRTADATSRCPATPTPAADAGRGCRRSARG